MRGVGEGNEERKDHEQADFAKERAIVKGRGEGKIHLYAQMDTMPPVTPLLFWSYKMTNDFLIDHIQCGLLETQDSR